MLDDSGVSVSSSEWRKVAPCYRAFLLGGSWLTIGALFLFCDPLPFKALLSRIDSIPKRNVIAAAPQLFQFCCIRLLRIVMTKNLMYVVLARYQTNRSPLGLESQ